MEDRGRVRIHETAIVEKGAEIGEGTTIGPYSIVGKGVKLGRNCLLISSVRVEGPSEFGDDNIFYPFSVTGGPPQDLKYGGEDTLLKVGDGNIFRESATVHRGTVTGRGETIVGSRCLFMANSHIAHDCIVGDHVIMANCAGLGGHTIVEEHSILGGLVAVHQFTRVGAFTMVGAGAVVVRDIPPYTMCAGNHARLYGINVTGLRRSGFPPHVIDAIKDAYSIVFLAGKRRREALDEVLGIYGEIPEVCRFIKFIEETKRGVTGHEGGGSGREI